MAGGLYWVLFVTNSIFGVSLTCTGNVPNSSSSLVLQGAFFLLCFSALKKILICADIVHVHFHYVVGMINGEMLSKKILQKLLDFVCRQGGYAIFLRASNSSIELLSVLRDRRRFKVRLNGTLSNQTKWKMSNFLQGLGDL